MAEQLGTLALRAILEGDELTQGFKKAEKDLTEFVAKTKGISLGTFFTDLGESAGDIFDSLKKGSLSEAAKKVVATLATTAQNAVQAMGPIGTAALAAAGAIAGIGIAARSTTREIAELAAAGKKNTFGDTPETIARAVAAEERWRRATGTAEGAWATIRRIGRETLVNISDDFASIAVSLKNFFDGPIVDVGAQLERRLAQRERDDLAGVRSSFNLLGAPTMDAQPILDSIDQNTRRAIAERARRWREMQQQLMRTPLDVIRDMNVRDFWAPYVTGAGEAISRVFELREQSDQLQRSVEGMTESWNRAAETMGRSAAEIRQIDIGRAEEDLARLGRFDFGGFLRARVDALRSADELLTRAEQRNALEERLNRLREEGNRIAESVRSPVERFDENIRRILADQTQSESIRLRAVGQEFNRLDRSLGAGPSSFGLSGTSSRSREGLLAADDFRIRGEINSNQNRVPNLLEQIRAAAARSAAADEALGRAVEQGNTRVIEAIDRNGPQGWR